MSGLRHPDSPSSSPSPAGHRLLGADLLSPASRRLSSSSSDSSDESASADSVTGAICAEVEGVSASDESTDENFYQTKAGDLPSAPVFPRKWARQLQLSLPAATLGLEQLAKDFPPPGDVFATVPAWGENASALTRVFKVDSPRFGALKAQDETLVRAARNTAVSLGPLRELVELTMRTGGKDQVRALSAAVQAVVMALAENTQRRRNAILNSCAGKRYAGSRWAKLVKRIHSECPPESELFSEQAVGMVHDFIKEVVDRSTKVEQLSRLSEKAYPVKSRPSTHGTKRSRDDIPARSDSKRPRQSSPVKGRFRSFRGKGKHPAGSTSRDNRPKGSRNAQQKSSSRSSRKGPAATVANSTTDRQ